MFMSKWSWGSETWRFLLLLYEIVVDLAGDSERTEYVSACVQSMAEDSDWWCGNCQLSYADDFIPAVNDFKNFNS